MNMSSRVNTNIGPLRVVPAANSYGNHYTWTFTSGWQYILDSPGTLELAYFNQLFNSIPWWKPGTRPKSSNR